MYRFIFVPIGGQKTNWSIVGDFFAVSLMFWAVFKQNGTALTRWAKNYTGKCSHGNEKPLENIYLVDVKDYKTREVPVYDEQYQIIKMKMALWRSKEKIFILEISTLNKKPRIEENQIKKCSLQHGIIPIHQSILDNFAHACGCWFLYDAS